MYCKIYYTKNIQNDDKTCSCILYTKWLCSKLHIIQCYECKWDMFMNNNEEIIAGDTDDNASYPDAS